MLCNILLAHDCIKCRIEYYGISLNAISFHDEIPAHVSHSHFFITVIVIIIIISNITIIENIVVMMVIILISYLTSQLR